MIFCKVKTRIFAISAIRRLLH